MPRSTESGSGRRRGALLLVLFALVTGVASTACTAGTPQPGFTATATASVSPTPSLPPVGVGCRDLATQGLTLQLTNTAGLRIAAVDLGSGPLGVVLAHQSDASMCQWLPYATVLAQQGYRVLAFDFVGYGASSPSKTKTYLEDIRTVVDYLRAHGTPHVVVIGASMGATMSIVAAAALTPPVDGVIAVSPPLIFDAVNAEKAAPLLHSPTLYLAGDEDGDYAVYAQRLADATPAALRQVQIMHAAEHGVLLVGAEGAAGVQTRAAIAAFLEVHLKAAAATATPSMSATR